MSSYNTRSTNQPSLPPGDESSGPPQLFPSPQNTHDHATPESSPLETPLPQSSQAPVMSQDLISLRILEVLERLSVQQASSDKSSSPTTATHIAKAPDAFKGSPKELENFLSSCILYMDAYPDEKGNAKRELCSLQQKGSASDFFLRLNQLLAVLDIPNDADLLVENMIYKLDGTLRDEIARNQDFDPKSIDELMDFIIPLDNCL
ncbi:hypothetical protein C351_03592 [Cryptococcus neoformans c8]|nr:hypothetical protein C353_06734 [Cryptococcus neoformans var. grubii AD1-83a]OXG44411.1 hypothetical protein C354_06715 [Cryptococcus neoformans var. grubii MW-RSA1955]OXG48193.1 hypothetical protein C352_06735 [Cryptococcus neoformans var. grubii CHC193]OXG62896.1 hypothetical protein C351_03592 [Cryptococcus neoformans var. grubii c8]OXH01292.1 hypothetical protein C369_06848 [Cryptococcus neoformans var. grubii A5-35-17]OXH02449.1 hypothetical protein C370_06908 [Cryptococcus neoformans 